MCITVYLLSFELTQALTFIAAFQPMSHPHAHCAPLHRSFVLPLLRSLFCALIRSQVCGGASRAVARTAPVAHAAAAHAEQAARARLPQMPPAGHGRRRGAHLYVAIRNCTDQASMRPGFRVQEFGSLPNYSPECST